MKYVKWEIHASDRNEIVVSYSEENGLHISQLKCCDDITLNTQCIENMISALREIFPERK